MEPGSMTPLGPHVTKAISTLLALGLPVHTLDFLLCLLGYLPARVEKTLWVNFQLQGSQLPALRACPSGQHTGGRCGTTAMHRSVHVWKKTTVPMKWSYEASQEKGVPQHWRRSSPFMRTDLRMERCFFKARNGNTQTGEGIACFEGTFKSCELWQPSSGTEY